MEVGEHRPDVAVIALLDGLVVAEVSLECLEVE